MKPVVDWIKSVFSDMKEQRVTSRVIAFWILVAVIIIALATIRLWFWRVAAVCVIVWLLYEYIKEEKEMQTSAQQNQRLAAVPHIYTAVFRALTQRGIAERLGLQPPAMLEDIVHVPNHDIVRGGMFAVYARCLKKSNEPMSDEDLRTVKTVLQQKLNGILQRGETPFYPIWDGNNPSATLVVRRVVELGIYAGLEIIFVDCQQTANQLFAELMQQSPERPIQQPTDKEF